MVECIGGDLLHQDGIFPTALLTASGPTPFDVLKGCFQIGNPGFQFAQLIVCCGSFVNVPWLGSDELCQRESDTGGLHGSLLDIISGLQIRSRTYWLLMSRLQLLDVIRVI